MSETVKICTKHGELKMDQVLQESMNNRLTFRFRCKQCLQEYREKNRDKEMERSRLYEKTKRKRPVDFYEKIVKPASREWRRRNSETVNEKVREDRKENPEKYLEYERSNRERNRLKIQEQQIIRKHDITYEEYRFMFEKQNGKCYICNKEETKKSRTTGQICRLAIDHNHKTGKIRKLLCHNCNIVVGHCKESIEFLRKTIEYLEKHEHVT